jgi:hypothetical protein
MRLQGKIALVSGLVLTVLMVRYYESLGAMAA